MQDRLAELRRQRALIAEHLAWLDREITAAGSASITPSAAPPPQVVKVAPPAPPLDPASILAKVAEPPATVAPSAPDDPHTDLLPEHRPADIKSDVRRGCFLYLALATLAVVVFGGLLVWASRAYKHSQQQPPRNEQPAERS